MRGKPGHKLNTVGIGNPSGNILRKPRGGAFVLHGMGEMGTSSFSC